MLGRVVDDDALFARTLARSLERHGIATLTATSGEEALALAGTRPLDSLWSTCTSTRNRDWR